VKRKREREGGGKPRHRRPGIKTISAPIRKRSRTDRKDITRQEEKDAARGHTKSHAQLGGSDYYIYAGLKISSARGGVLHQKSLQSLDRGPSEEDTALKQERAPRRGVGERLSGGCFDLFFVQRSILGVRGRAGVPMNQARSKKPNQKKGPAADPVERRGGAAEGSCIFKHSGGRKRRLVIGERRKGAEKKVSSDRVHTRNGRVTEAKKKSGPGRKDREEKKNLKKGLQNHGPTYNMTETKAKAPPDKAREVV